MDRAELLASLGGFRHHAALTDHQTDPRFLDELRLGGLHSSAGRRPDRNHVLLAVLIVSDDRARMEDRTFSEVETVRKPALDHDSLVSAVTACGQRSGEIYGVSDLQIFDLVI